MSSQLQAFGSWRIILLNSDDLGDDGDVLTRVGENAAAFRPGGGGGAAWGSITGTLSAQTDLQSALDAVTFDQSLNTDDAVVFGSVSIASGLTLNISPGGAPEIRTSTLLAAVSSESVEDSNHIFKIWNRGGGAAAQAEFLLQIGEDPAPMNQTSFSISASQTVIQVYGINNGDGPDLVLQAADAVTNGDGGDLKLVTGALAGGGANGNLLINGTPGVTDAAIVVDGVTLSFTKGILTGVA